ncbi:MAG: tetratricopeptide repeat protein, partial [Flavobacteriales bacterium]|nr:tetratricopeptide repeat protein [Flavobacteriales bacterium]
MNRILVYLSLVLLTLPIAAMGGSNKIDSPMRLVWKAGEDTNKVNLLNMVATDLLLTQPDSAFRYVDQAFDLAESLGVDSKIAECYSITGNIYRAKYDYTKALELHLEVLEMYEDMGVNLGWSIIEVGNDYYLMNSFDTARQYFNRAVISFEKTRSLHGRAVSLNNLGMVSQVQGDYLEALGLFIQSAEIYEHMGRMDGLAWSYQLISDVYYQQGDADKALEYLLKTKKIYGKKRDKRGLMQVYLKLGPIYSTNGERSEALDNYGLALRFAQDLGDNIHLAIANNKIGEIYIAKREYDRALTYQQKALDIQEGINDKLNMCVTLNSIGNIYLEMLNGNDAILYLEKSVKTAEEIGYKIILHESYANLAEAYSVINDYKSAFKYQVLYTEMHDEMFGERRMLKIQELQAKYENKKDQEEILLLTKENRIQELEARRDGVFNYSLITGIILLALLGFVTYNRYLIKRKAVQDLKDINDDMEDTIEERTQEVFQQKERIEKTFKDTKLLSGIGKSITACLSVEKIVEKSYENINELMVASSFAIGMYNEEANALDFPGVYEKGKVLPFFSVSLDQDDQMPIACFKNKQEILINDMTREAKKYIGVHPDEIALKGERTAAMIYLPLYIKKKPVGVISVQSFEMDVYTTYNMDMLRSVAVYVGIAIENAKGYERVEEQVKERTAEVVAQKQEIEKAYEDVELLSGIGKDVTSSLSVEEIIGTVYKNVNTLMDASVFFIGIYNEEKQIIEFNGAKEKDKIFPPFSYDLNDDTRIAVWCYKNQKEVFINDYQNELSKYISKIRPVVVGDPPESLMYLPVVFKEKKIGVISVQS